MRLSGALPNALILAALVAVAVGADLTGNPYIVTLATKVAIFGLAGVGLNLALGYGGLVSFGHAAFFGLGGYVTAILASHATSGTPVATFPFTMLGTNEMLAIWPFAIAVPGLAALVIGALSLRTTGVYFIMVTLAFAQMLYYFAISWPTYGGEDGLSFYVRNSFPGLNTFAPLQFFAITAAALGITMILVALLTQSRFGLALRAAKENETRVIASGIKPFAIRLTAFVLSGMVAGLAGALVRRPQPVRQPDDAQLAHVGRDHDFRHPRRRRATGGADRRGGGLHRARIPAGPGQRPLAGASWPASDSHRALRAEGADGTGAWEAGPCLSQS